MAGRQAEDDLLAELEKLGKGDASKPVASTSSTKPSTKSTAPAGAEDEDVLADLQAQLAAKPATSRPGTPRMSSSATSGTARSPKRAEHTPPSSGPPSGRTSEDRLRSAPAPTRSSGEGRSYHQGFTPGSPSGKKEAQGASETAGTAETAGGGWWGSMFSAASAAVKQAEHLAKEIRSNEEAQRWTEQMKGNLSSLQNLGIVYSFRRPFPS